jgi:hypothetical protein
MKPQKIFNILSMTKNKEEFISLLRKLRNPEKKPINVRKD